MKWLSNLIFIALIISIVLVLVIGGLSELSSREYLFLSILLTGLAIAASWLGTSRVFKATSEQMKQSLKDEYSENLRTYALKAAEKVQNLSSEIERLTEYLRESLTIGESADIKLAQEKLKTAILMLETLKSVNDTALSDWRGIISDELQKQEEVQIDIDNIYRKLEMLEDIQLGPPELRYQLALPGIDLEDIDRDITDYASRSPIPVRLPRKRRIDALVRCPMCKSENQTRIKLRDGYKKVVKCKTCGLFFSTTVDSELNINTAKIETKEKSMKCMLCDKEITVTYPLWPGYSFQPQCSNCHSLMRASVNSEGDIQFHQYEMITKKFLDILEQMLGGTYPGGDKISAIATEFGVSKSKVAQGADVLFHLERIQAPEEGVLLETGDNDSEF